MYFVFVLVNSRTAVKSPEIKQRLDTWYLYPAFIVYLFYCLLFLS